MGGGQVSFRFLNKPTLNSTFYVFCCLLLLKLCINLVLLSCADKKVTKEARERYLRSLFNCTVRPVRLNSDFQSSDSSRLVTVSLTLNALYDRLTKGAEPSTV